MNLLDARPVPSRVLGTIRTAITLQKNGLLTRKRLESLVGPPSIAEKDNTATTIGACLDMGALQLQDSDALTVEPSLTSEARGPNQDLAGALVDYLLRKLATDSLDPAFSRIQAWALMQKASDIPITLKHAETLWNQQDPGRHALGLSGVIFNSFTYWSRFLGFAGSQSIAGTMALLPDPTTFLERKLAMLFRGTEDRRLPLFELLRRAEQTCPWIENGVAAIETRTSLAAPPSHTDGWVNDSTALALRRLEKKGLIQLERLSDADKPMTLGWGGASRIVSDVAWGASK